MSKRVTDLLRFAINNDLDIVSFGLAPNPNGFCFESHGKASDAVKQYLATELESLSRVEIEQLKKAVFA